MLSNGDKASEGVGGDASLTPPASHEGTLGSVTGPPRPQSVSDLRALQEYLSGRADAATIVAFEAALADPDSLLSRGLRDALGRRPTAAPQDD